MAQAARGVAALTSEPAVQAAVLDTASDVLDKASSLIEEAKKAANRPGDPESQQRLAQVRGREMVGKGKVSPVNHWPAPSLGTDTPDF